MPLHARPATSGAEAATTSREVAASVDQVWSALSDGWLMAAWVVGASRMRHVDPSWPAKGSHVEHSFGAWPLVVDDRTDVVHVETGSELVLRARGWPLGEATVRLGLSPLAGDRTLVVIEEDATAGPGRFVPAPLRRIAIGARNVEALRRLAYLAEGRAQA